MKNTEIRNRIIEITCDIITRQGIRSARVDEIARAAGISKRTLYETFDDKSDLIFRCLERLSEWRRGMLERKFEADYGNSLYAVMAFVHEYLDSLYLLESGFLVELKSTPSFAETFDNDYRFWLGRLTGMLRQTAADGYVSPDADVELIAETILVRSYELRVTDRDRAAQSAFSRALLRGISTSKGIALFDDMPAQA